MTNWKDPEGVKAYRREYQRKWREKNHEHYLEYWQAWRDKKRSDPETAEVYRRYNADKAMRHYHANREECLERMRQWRKENPDLFVEIKRNAALKGRYGITSEQYEAMLEAQGGVCAICGEKCSVRKRLSVDHDHKTGTVRGLLCNACNAVLGLSGEDISVLGRAVDYLLSYWESEDHPMKDKAERGAG